MLEQSSSPGPGTGTPIASAAAITDVLQVRGLRVYYHTTAGAVKAVNDISFGVRPVERFGLVGESGSGKSTIALALMRMIRPPGKIEGGQVILEETDLLKLDDEQMRRMRLAAIALVAQGAMNSLNPVLRVRDQIYDAMRDHDVRMSRGEFTEKVGDLLDAVGLRKSVADMYPHELSGGMKQRVCIAIAMCLRPRVIIADEPTSALDVVVQRQVMDTLETVQEDLKASVILIGHDMGLMAQTVERLGVMYAGNIIEIANIKEIFAEPLHPYTQLLIASLPSLDHKGTSRGIPGLPPSLVNRPTGCLFRQRCPFAMDRCAVEEPALREVRPGRWVSCHLY